MKLTQKLQNVADLVSVLMMSSKQFDMGTIERAMDAEMDHEGVEFITDEHRESFLDQINAMSINERKIEELVGLYII